MTSTCKMFFYGRFCDILAGLVLSHFKFLEVLTTILTFAKLLGYSIDSALLKQKRRILEHTSTFEVFSRSKRGYLQMAHLCE